MGENIVLKNKVEDLDTKFATLQLGTSFAANTVAFTVQLTSTIAVASYGRIPYNNVLTNIGGGYSIQRNEFVAPEAGTYVFSAGDWPSGSCILGFSRDEENLGNMIWGTTTQPQSIGSNTIVLEL